MQTVFLIYYFLIINVLAFVLYGVDKRRAIRNQYRIRESVLLWMARLGGGVGSWLLARNQNLQTQDQTYQVQDCRASVDCDMGGCDCVYCLYRKLFIAPRRVFRIYVQ